MDKLLYTEEGTGETREITKNEYLKAIAKELDIKPAKVGDDDVPVDMIMNHVWKVNDRGQDPEEELKAAYPKLFARVEQDFKTSKEITEGSKKNAEEEKKKKEEEKEAEKKAAAEKEQKIIAHQTELAPALQAGADTAAAEFKAQLADIGSRLPEGMKLVQTGEGFAIVADEKATDETLVTGMGYLIQSAMNNEFMAGVFQFTIGDLTNALVKREVYRTGKEAGEHVQKLLANAGKKMAPSMISQYAKMAERVPAESRNPRVQPTAYLEVANIPIAKKGDKETDASFKERVNKINEGKAELLAKLAKGEVLERGGIVDEVKKLKEETGLTKIQEGGFNLTETLKAFFFLKITKENFMDVHVEGVARFKQGDKTYDLTTEQVDQLLADTQSQLTNYYFTKKKEKLSFKDFVEGKKENIVKGGQVDSKGKKVDRHDVVEIYPEPFWSIEEEEATAEPAAEPTEDQAAKTPAAEPVAEEAPKEEAKKEEAATA